jgi:hypothetical protein
VSYHGHIINVDWYLSARADIPWAVDTKAETEVLIAAGRGSASSPAAQLHSEAWPSTPREWFAKLDINPRHVALAFILVLCGIIYLSWPLIDEDGVVWFQVAQVLLFAGGVGLMVFRLFRNNFARLKLGQVDINVPPQVIAGETFSVDVTMKPAKGVTIDGIELEILATEIAVSGSGTSSTTHTHELFKSISTLLTTGHHITPNQPLRVQGLAQIPAGAACSFRSDNNTVKWVAIVHIDVPNWPDLREGKEILVPPVNCAEKT